MSADGSGPDSCGSDGCGSDGCGLGSSGPGGSKTHPSGQGNRAFASHAGCPEVQRFILCPAKGSTLCTAHAAPPLQSCCAAGSTATAAQSPGAWTPLMYDPGQSLAEALFLSGELEPPVLCSGLGLCGRCRVRLVPGPQGPSSSTVSSFLAGFAPFPEESAVFSPEDLAQGMRLACRRPALPGLHVEIAAPRAQQSILPGQSAERAVVLEREPHIVPDAPLLAVDLGTTSLVWRLLDATGSTLAQGRQVNPQMGAGSDVMSRLAVALKPGGLRRLAGLTQTALRAITALASRTHGAPAALCLAANPAMSAIALGIDPASLAAAPYSLPEKGGRWFSLSQLPPLWVPPQLSPFVGGDIAAGLAALLWGGAEKAPAYPFILADLGTNGEFLLALDAHTSLAASVPLGPALEGSGLSHGTEARPGAINDFSFGPGGIKAGRIPGADSAKACGITGTGVLALLRTLLRCGVLNRDGQFQPQTQGPLARFFPFGTGFGGQRVLLLPDGLSLSASDVEEMLKVKAAFSLAFALLVRKAGLEARDLSGMYIAGALGAHVRREVLADLGFFPPGLEKRLFFIGNSALDGAALLAAKPEMRHNLVQWSSTVTSLDLASDPDFISSFSSHMSFGM